MRYNFWQKNKIVFAIIFGAIIIGGCVYFAIKTPLKAENKVVDNLPYGKNLTSSSVVKVAPQVQKSAEAGPLQKAVCEASENSIVTKVIDGDTVVVEGGWHVRLLGMDADEKGYPCYDVAKTRLENLVLGKIVKLEKDKTDVDQYGRCLRYIFLGGENIDAQLVKEGLAVARFYAPDLKYKIEISTAEQQAISAKTGCKWSGSSQTAN